MIPDKCKNWKLANIPVLNLWCKLICGNTNGKICEPWCKIIEKYGLWTLPITLGIPIILIIYIIIKIF